MIMDVSLRLLYLIFNRLLSWLILLGRERHRALVLRHVASEQQPSSTRGSRCGYATVASRRSTSTSICRSACNRAIVPSAAVPGDAR
jgi:hypothetical protein